MIPFVRRALVTAALALTAALMFAASASAATATLSITDAGGKSDPVAGIGRTFSVTGNVEAKTELYVKYRPAGGAPCTASASTDSGTYLFGSTVIGGPDIEGNYRVQDTRTWQQGPGTFQFCIWLANAPDATSTPFTQNVTFRAPNGTVSATINPVAPLPDQTATITVTGSSEAPTQLYAKLRPAGGAACAPSPDADSGSYELRDESVNGAFTKSTTTSFEAPGDYLLCLWLAGSSSAPSPIAGPQPVVFTVAAPPPPCVVPSIAPGTSLFFAVGALTGANCTLGAQTFTPSRTYPRGTVIRATTTSGTSLAPQAPVGLLLSSGKPCRVPKVTRNLSVSGAKTKLRRAGCTPGKRRTARSRKVRRGKVVRFSPSSGRTLKPRARVSIVVSRGRR